MNKSDRDFADQVAGDVGGCALLGLSAIVVGVITWLRDVFRSKPEAELRTMDSSSHWGSVTVEVHCAACGASNESSSKQCVVCGKPLTHIPDSWSDKAIKPAGMDPALLWVAIIGLLLFVVFCVIVASSFG